MKIRTGFVSNSSSTAFLIQNTSAVHKTLVDFVAENPHLVEDFNAQYDYEFTQEQMLHDAEVRGTEFAPGEEKECVFGDEQGTTIGHVFDYILREGGKSSSFRWQFKEYYR